MLLVCSIYKKKETFQSPSRGQRVKIPFRESVFYTYASEVQREKSTTTLVVFKLL